MLPNIRLVIAAIVATIGLVMGGFGLVATFQIAKMSIDTPSRGAPPLNPALADRPQRNRDYASTGTPRINEGAPRVDMPSTHTAAAELATKSTPAARSDADTVVGTSAATSPTELVLPTRSDERAPAVTLTEDAAATAPIASSEVEAPTIDIDGTSAPSSPAAILTTPHVAAAVTPSPGQEAMETASPSRPVPEVGSSSRPVETTVAASPSQPAGEKTTTASPGSTAVTIAPNAESSKAPATRGKRARRATKPHAQAKEAKAHQATTSKAKVSTAAHVRRRSFQPAIRSTDQPQNPANPFWNFFGSQQVGRSPPEIGAAR
jgi:hypothetical protein